MNLMALLHERFQVSKFCYQSRHEITKQELINYSPSLADKVARSTGTHTVEEIATEIIEVIRSA